LPTNEINISHRGEFHWETIFFAIKKIFSMKRKNMSQSGECFSIEREVFYQRMKFYSWIGIRN
jgi:hypothetical protein